MGYISDLLQTLIGLGIGQEITGGVDSARNPHLAGFRDFPQVVVNPVKFHNLDSRRQAAKPGASFATTRALLYIQNDTGRPEAFLAADLQAVIGNRLHLTIISVRSFIPDPAHDSSFQASGGDLQILRPFGVIMPVLEFVDQLLEPAYHELFQIFSPQLNLTPEQVV